MPHITSPLGYFNEIFFINMKRYQNLMGLNFVTNPNYKPIFRTYFWLGLVYLFLVLTVYTMITYDADTAWKAFSFFGLGIQVCWRKSKNSQTHRFKCNDYFFQGSCKVLSLDMLRCWNTQRNRVPACCLQKQFATNIRQL